MLVSLILLGIGFIVLLVPVYVILKGEGFI